MRLTSLLAIPMLFSLGSAVIAQSPKNAIALGDKDYAERKAPSALAHYEAAIAADSNNVEALWKASRTAVVVGEEMDKTDQTTMYVKAGQYAQRAFTLDSTNANVRFAQAQGLGRVSLTVSMMERGKYAKGIYDNGVACLKLNPKHPDCMQLLGMWHAGTMRVQESLRNFAINMMGLKVLANANWNDARRLLEGAARAEPKRATHHLELGRLYVDLKEPKKASAEFNAAINAPLIDYNDARYKAEAKAALDSLGT